MVDRPSLCVGCIIVNADRKRKRGGGRSRHRIRLYLPSPVFFHYIEEESRVGGTSIIKGDDKTNLPCYIVHTLPVDHYRA